MSNVKMTQFVAGLKSRNEETRVKAACDLQRYVTTELREVSLDELLTFLDEFNHHIFEMVSSNDINEKKGGIYAIMSLVDVDVGQTGVRISRFANYLKNLVNSPDTGVTELTAKAVGRLALASGTFTAEYVEDLVKRSFEWLQGDRNEGRRHAAVLVLRELALSVPTYFFQQVQQFLDVIFNAVRDPKPQIREGAVAALRVALAITAQRETKEMQQTMWYKQCLTEVWAGFDDQANNKDRSLTRDDRIHGSLLVLNELLRCSNTEWERLVKQLRHLTHYQTPPPKKDSMSSVVKRLRGQGSLSSSSHTPHDLLSALPSHTNNTIGGTEITILDQPCESRTCRELILEKYDSISTQVLNQKTSRNNIIQSALLQIIPRLAALNKEKFSQSYLSGTMTYLLGCLRGRDKERPTAFITLGLLAVAVGPAIKKYLPKIMEVIKASLPTKDTPSKKRVVEPAVYVCVSLVARGVEGAVRNDVKELLEPMMATGLSPPLTLALQELATEIPSLKRDIAEGLLRMLSQILMHRSTPHSRSGVAPPPSSPDHQDTGSLVLALRTLGSFDFEGTGSFRGQSLMQFVRHVADHYLSSEHREVRLEAVRTCCHLLRPTFASLGRRASQSQTHIIFNIVSKVLWVCVTDMDPDVRLCVLASLDESFDSHLAQPENLNALIYALSDEVFEIREHAITILGRLSAINPAYVHPLLRKALLKILDELDYSGIGRNRELSAHMLGQLIGNAQRFMRQFVQAIMSVLVPKLKDQDPNPAVTMYVLMAIGDLAQVSGGEMQKWLPELMPLLLEMLADGTSGWKRRVALWTLGQLVENTGYVVHPYTQHPTLLDVLLSFLKTEQQPAVRRETIRVLGLLGALDPYKHKMNVGMIKIQEDTGVAVISTSENKTDELSGEMGTSEMLVNLNYSSLEEFYPTCAIAMLMKVIKDPTLGQHHNEVVRAVTFIFKSLGVKGVPYLAQVIPSLLYVIRTADANFRDYLFQQLATLIGIVKQHIRNYLDDIIEVLKEFWVTGGKLETTITIITVVESIALAVGSEFKIYLKELVPMILKSCINDSKEKQVTGKLLLAFQKFGATLEEFLHMILPHIVKLFDASDVPLSVRRTALETVDHFADYLDLSDYTSKIIHPLLRTLDTCPELRDQAMEVLCALATQLGRSYECFIPIVYRITTKHKIHHPRYDILVAKVVRGLTVSDDEMTIITAHQRARRPRSRDHQLEADSTTIKKHTVGVQSLQKAWLFTRLVSKDDWLEWLRRFSIELMKASPSPALRSCYSVATTYVQLSRDLFNAAFVSCWSELNESLQDDLLQSLRQALTSQDIPEITQTLLNLAEFMEHCDKGPLPLELQLLGEKAMECRAYAKALHYKEEEFHKGPTSEVLEHLISINNKLGQKEAAAGLLEYARKNNRTDMKVQERWHEKLHDWDQALQAYQTKLETRPDDLELTLGQMRCLEALGEWGELYSVSCEWWSSSMNDECRAQMARVAAASAWAMGQWTSMEEYTKFIPRDTQEGAFYRAVLSVHKDQYPVAQQLIDSARDLLDTELTAMVGESYQRAYNAMVAVQMLAELEEVIQYKLVPERRQPITQIWWERLQGCQRVVEDWQKILQVRSLVLSPQEDMRPWLKFASLCRKSGRLTLSHKTLVRLLGCDPSTNTQQVLPATHPRVTYQYCKHIYTYPNRRHEAYGHLQNFLQYIAPAVGVGGCHNNDNKLRELVSRVHLKLGEWYEQLHGLNEDNINTILTYYTHAKDTDKLCYKAWHAYAYMNFEAILFYKNKADSGKAENGDDTSTPSKKKKSAGDFTIAAVKGFIRSISLSDGNSLQDTLRLLTVWFEHGHQSGVYEALVDGLKTIQIDTWLQVIPQLIARIDTPRTLVGKLIHQLLMDIGKHHPQALIYPLTVAAKSSVVARSQAAEKILKNMREHSANLVQQAMMVSEELIRVAILWHEIWHEGLEEASRLYFGERNETGMFRTLGPLHAMMERGPQTLKEMSFNQAYGPDLRDAQEWCRRYQRTGNVRELNQAWDLYYHVFRRISRQLPQLTSLELQSVSPRLLKCRDLDIAVPGSYAPNSPVICISQVQSSLQVLTSKQRPRKLCIRGSNGRDIVFLLKGHEDLRQDERVMQLFGLVNTLLISNPDTFRRNLTIQRFAVIPLSTNSGLIGWVPHCDTLHALIRDWREKKKILLNIEHRIMMRMAQDLEHLTLMQKVEVFEHALEHTQGDDLARLLWFKSPSSEVWFDRRTNYTRSLAVMSMVGYVLGLGDRHPSNLMLDQLSGKIIHIDFGDCFEVAMTREKFPEKIPFRLTRMLINAMEVTGIDGTYRMTCESVMSLIRRNKDSLMAMLEAFVYDPLLNWRLMDHAQPKSKRSVVGETVSGGGVAATDPGHTPIMEAASTSSGAPTGSQTKKMEVREDSGASEALNKKAVAIVNRVRDKLTGRDFNNDEPLDVHKQVELLIAQATSHENLCQCYIGWCPFW
ncbi:serine/threonine-protein kinase mTOR isoform X1 [Penaeus vannamei]|uniref:serine/threonine-protein kinase mTOR isoform X1 n=1 Tax=Penaeus vannamei TaxID=6689 RepID=UPI000F68B901|nr:serine/threonine-protein kinase mTOR-like [Penaeus vannamei]